MINKSIISLLLVFSCLNLNAQSFQPAADQAKILAELKKTSQATTSIQAAFTEEKHLAVLKEPERSSGVFYFKQNKMRWEQKNPVKYVIMINGDKLRIEEGGKEKNVGQASRMAAQIKELMIGLVNGDFQQNKAFSIAALASDDQYMIVLTPVNRRLKNIYSKITMVFPKSTLRLKELTFFDKGGDRNLLRFHSEKFNSQINDSLFEIL
ncbi:outer membrane lipoprotein carrier protein LolA [Dyadobacter sp. CY343]|uniref:LolA family protein n=1 Tax=Dyadobacter sp. CY343 TaxID=2907299 RepID=UPI001F4528E8|nr:outer membrane lipoprotein carrier protein LolA [Dyadobacter sp. CY343]MCE7062095.1 outer membrane lipoprotein carrier protein LolA [Dyadobacter sp. CY343]